MFSLPVMLGILFFQTIANAEVDFVVKIPSSKDSLRLSFASCHDFPGKYSIPTNDAGVGVPFNWDLIIDREPFAFIWGGDIIYGDFPKEMQYMPYLLTVFLPDMPIFTKPFVAASGEKLNHMYQSLKKDPGYAKLEQTLGGIGSQRVLGTWDDHDFGLNDADKTLSIRDESKEAFLNFFDAKSNDPRRFRDGVYSSTLFIDENGDESKSVLVIALDLRYNKDPYSVKNGDFLGEKQWKWLEETLSQSKARSHVFISSLQLLSQGKEAVTECWSDFPDKRERILKLIHDMKVKAPIIISGDVHYAEVMAANCGFSDNDDDDKDGIISNNLVGETSTIVELTTSGLTHSWANGMGSFSEEMKRISALALEIFQTIFIWSYQTKSEGNKRDFTIDLNFGEIEFLWSNNDENNDPKVLVKILHGTDGNVLINKEYYLKDLDMENTKMNKQKNGKKATTSSSICRPQFEEPHELRQKISWIILIIIVLFLLLLKPMSWILIGITFYRLTKNEPKKTKEN